MNSRLIVIPAGDPAIYKSEDVFAAETKPGALDAPVHEDIRGTIKRIDLNGVKVNMLFTKGGFMRSGDLHPHAQYDILFSGRIELWTLEEGETKKQIIEPNTFFEIGPHVPHLFNFLEDSVMAEWWGGPFVGWYYRPWRTIIDEQFKKMIA